MKQYHEHLEAILKYGSKKDPAREGMPGSLSLFGYQNRYELSKGFPILTTKKINFKNIVVELLWILRGDTNIKYLKDNGCNIWDEDAYNYYVKQMKLQYIMGGPEILDFDEFRIALQENDICHDLDNYNYGDCGKQYGWLWRNWSAVTEMDRSDTLENPDNWLFEEIDQIKNLIEGLKFNPEGRRHIITAWNPATLDDMALNACHSFVQFNCRKVNKYSLKKKASRFWMRDIEDFNDSDFPDYYLDCQLYQRSADMFLGVPYNISSYALLTEIIAKICNMIPGDFIHTFGDSHIYDNHIDQVKEQLSRDPEKYELSKLKIDHNIDIMVRSYKDDISGFIEALRWNDFELEGYESYPAIKGKLSTGLK